MASKIVNIIRKAVILLFKLILSIYFKEIHIIGLDKIPKEGPIIFVCNHANQYIDPMNVCVNSPHHICFLVAASTYRQKIMGFLAKLFGAIPVERPQDIAAVGKGEFTITDHEGEYIVTGYGSEFKKQAVVGDTLRPTGQPDFLIARIISDTEMIVKSNEDFTWESEKRLTYKIAPKIDQSHVFKSVWDELKAGKCIGIFPEGGSHDRTDLLPLKVGVAIMALGAMSTHKDLKVKVVA